MGRLDSNAERNTQISCRRNDGLSFAAIAQEFKLSPAAVRDIVEQMERNPEQHEGGRDAQYDRVISLMRSLVARIDMGH
jgi:transposase